MTAQRFAAAWHRRRWPPPSESDCPLAPGIMMHSQPRPPAALRPGSLPVGGTLTTFGCVEWESEQFRGVMRARCYPFKLPERRFHGVNPQVYKLVYTIIYMYMACGQWAQAPGPSPSHGHCQ